MLNITLFEYNTSDNKKVLSEIIALYTLPVVILEGNKKYPEIEEFLKKVLDLSNYIDSSLIGNIREKITGVRVKKTIKDFFKGAHIQEKLDDLVIPKEIDCLIKTKRENWRKVFNNPIFIINTKKYFKNGHWGVTLGRYSYSLVIATKNNKELLYHEFFHILDLSEGYNDNNKTPLLGCENCWMQYDPTEGGELELCEKHKKELEGGKKKILL